MISDDKLEPCPFCGGEAEIYEPLVARFWFVRCSDGDTCGTCGPDRETRSAAIEAWNTRAERTCTNSYRGGCTVAFKCSSCGDSVFYPKKGSGKHVKLKYCHNCGAKVVNDAD